MLRLEFQPDLMDFCLHQNLIPADMWLMEDEARPHTTRIMWSLLTETIRFGRRTIGIWQASRQGLVK